MRKYSADEKVRICEEYLSGKSSSSEICAVYGLGKGKASGAFWRWVSQYRRYGKEAFSRVNGHRSYTKELKEQAVREYLSGNGSLMDICFKYDILDETTLIYWTKCYNANIELRDYNPKREVYMASAKRKTTLDERKVIAEYCIAHDKDYKGTAALYSVSYSQVYSWVRKYLSNGAEGLVDNRGHHKTDDAVDELEQLRREVQRLQRQLEDEKRTVALLKKVNELEGM